MHEVPLKLIALPTLSAPSFPDLISIYRDKAAVVEAVDTVGFSRPSSM